MKIQQNCKILLVDDDEMSLKSLHSFLSSEGYFVNSYQKPSDALLSSSQSEYQVIITDYSMPEMTGLKLIQLIRKKHPEIFTILYTGYSTKTLEQESVNKNSVDYYTTKPLRIKELISIIDCITNKELGG